jgi:hypothetical protein
MRCLRLGRRRCLRPSLAAVRRYFFCECVPRNVNGLREYGFKVATSSVLFMDISRFTAAVINVCKSSIMWFDVSLIIITLYIINIELLAYNSIYFIFN